MSQPSTKLTAETKLCCDNKPRQRKRQERTKTELRDVKTDMNHTQ